MNKIFLDYLLNVNRFKCREIILSENDKRDVIQEIIVPVLIEIGDGWQNGIYSLSQVYMSSVICEELSEELFKESKRSINQKANIGIVTFDDYHTFGKKLVILSLKSAGYIVHDFGMVFDEQELYDLVEERDIDILLMSVLMLPPALKIKDLKPKLLEINPKIKVVVGGAPFRFDNNLWKLVDADATGANPEEAIKLIKDLEATL